MDYLIRPPFNIFCLYMGFEFIECFTTTFLHTHSWLNWVDEDEVGLKEKPDTVSHMLSQFIAIIGTADSETYRCVKPEVT